MPLGSRTDREEYFALKWNDYGTKKNILSSKWLNLISVIVFISNAYFSASANYSLLCLTEHLGIVRYYGFSDHQ